MELKLPPEIRIGNLIGEGWRCVVYQATYRDEPVAVKAYRPDMMAKCQHRYGITRSAFEYRRACEAYRIETIRRHIARPIALYGEGDGYSHAFVQQRVEGIRLRELLDETGSAPPETLAALRTIVRAVHAAEIYDLDLCANNIRVQKTAEGWQPILYDFNMLPAYLFGRNPITKLLYKVGLIKPWVRDLRHLKDFENWRNRARRYRVPLLGLRFRTRLLNRFDFCARFALSPAQPQQPHSEHPTTLESNREAPISELSVA